MPLWRQGDGGVDLRDWPTYNGEFLISKWGLAGRFCFAGIDLAWTTDMAALALLFVPLKESEQWKSLLFFWLPSERLSDIERRTRAPLTSWTRPRFLETTNIGGLHHQVSVDLALDPDVPLDQPGWTAGARVEERGHSDDRSHALTGGRVKRGPHGMHAGGHAVFKQASNLA
jgi:hypothetical protein